MIKPGAIHTANGGYLVLNVLDIFRTGHIWETLKTVLKEELLGSGVQVELFSGSDMRDHPDLTPENTDFEASKGVVGSAGNNTMWIVSNRLYLAKLSKSRAS